MNPRRPRCLSILLEPVAGASRSVLFLVSCLWILVSPTARAIVDTNDNGLSDLWEKHFNSGSLFPNNFDPQADLDGDGWTNEQEAAAGTDPRDGNSPTGYVRTFITHIQAVYTTDVNGDLEIVTPEAMTITWPTLVGKQYTLLSSVDLTSGSWIPIGYPELGTGGEIGVGVEINQSAGAPPGLFFRVLIEDIDSDEDSLTNFEERALGTSSFFVDTDDDGINDDEALAMGLHPAGNGIDEDGDGVPDNQQYTVVFEFVLESHNAFVAPGFSLTSDDKSRYFTKDQSEKYSVSGSPRIASATDKTYNFKETYFADGALRPDAVKITEEVGEEFTTWFYDPANATALGPNEILHWEGETTDIIHTGPVTTVTAEKKETVTTETRTRSWTIYEDGEEARSGTEVISIERKTVFSNPLSIQDCWNNMIQAQPWTEYATDRYGPLRQIDQVIGGLGELGAASLVRSFFQYGNFGIYGKISAPAISTVYGSDYRIKSAQWRWVRFVPQDPFNYRFATPPASAFEKFNWIVEERHWSGQSPIPDEVTQKGIIEIECKGDEGTTGWQQIPLSKLNAFKIDAPKGLESMDFAGNEGRTEVIFNNLPSYGLTGAGNRKSHNLDNLTESTGPPTVHLEAIEASDVTVGNGEATLQIEGEVYDAIMGAVPAGKGADIGSVTVFINGTETEFEAALERSATSGGFLAPYGPRATIPPFSITMPASGINRVSVVTAPNAAGIRGRAEFDVNFEKSFDPAASQPARHVAYDILLPSSFSPTVRETISLALPGLPGSDDLEETGDDTRTFVSAVTGATIVVSSGFQPTVQVDNLPCVISIPSIITGGGSSEKAAPCVETGDTTLRFAYRLNLPAQSQAAAYEWTLSSVDIGLEGYQGVNHPITFSRPWEESGESVAMMWQGENFPFTPATGAGGARYASTAAGKPMIGFLVPKKNEEGPDSRELIYYDHTSQTLKRKVISATVTDLPYQLQIDGFTTDDIRIQVCGWQLLDLNLEPAEGLLPVSIESLIDLADGDSTVEIPDESQAIIEISGRSPGEVLRVFSPEETDDHFDLKVPGEAPKITVAPRNVTLISAGELRYRSEEKLVIYSRGGEDDPATLTDAQWQSLKALGYLAVHNAAPVIASTKDLAWAIKEFGPPHPGENVPMGTSGITDPRKSQFYRFEGYEDHHVFNQYDRNPTKRARWKVILGDDFDVDEFTVPVKKAYHQKISKRITDEWESFLEKSFDTSHQLKPGVDIQQLRRATLDKMRDINGRWGIDTSRLRPYPSIIDSSLRTRPTLCNRLIENKGRLGSSLDKLKVIDEMAFGPLLKGANTARNAWWKTTIKNVLKREGKKGVSKVVPILSTAITVASIASASANVTQVGWEEAVAQEINNQLGLDDIELAREAVRQQFNTGLIGGGTPRPVLQLPNGQAIGMYERTYTCTWNNSGKINDFVPYVITEIKVFPDGSSKIAAVMEAPPFESLIVEDPDHIIRDYWPKIGDASSLYLQARTRAMANQGGNP